MKSKGSLRAAAEQIISEQPEKGMIQANLETEKLIHELGVHQIELEMQNEELRQTQEKLEESRSKYAELYDSAPVGYFVLDARGFVVDANLTGCTILDDMRNNVIGRPFFTHVVPDDRHLFDHYIRQVLEGKQPDRCELRLRKSKGEIFYAVLDTALSSQHSKRPSLVRMTMSDVTSRKKLENERTRMVKAIEQTSEGVVTVLPEGSIEYANRAFSRISGYPWVELQGQNIALVEVHEPDKPDQLEKNLWDAMLTKAGWTGLLDMRRSDGTMIKVEFSVSAVHDEKGDIFSYVMTFRDVTEKLKLERQLRQAQKLEAIGTLAGGIAHDFNNMLAAIIGFAEMLAEDIPEESASSVHVRRILQAAVRARDLVKQILAYSRRSDKDVKPLDLASLVVETCSLLKASIPSTIKLNTRINCSLPVLGDAAQLQEVIMNLCTNAIHTMRDTGGFLTIGLAVCRIEDELRDGDKQGFYVKLTVSDTGKGMKQKVMERAFDPFFTTKGPGEGTGMGLSVVYGIVKMHGGHIDLKSIEGRGTTATIYLPVTEKAPVERAMGLALQPRQAARKDGKILFVDDEEAIRELGREALERLGHSVVTATNGLEAVEMFHHGPDQFYLIISDQTMPHMTGIELARVVRTIRPDIPIILCTGYSDLVTPDTTGFFGIDQFLTKPFAKRDLVVAVQKALKKDDQT